MLGKIRPESEDWHDVSRTDSQKPQRAPPSDDRYRKVERDKQRPPSKDEQEQKGVETEKKPRNVYDLSKQEKPKPKSSLDRPSPKGKAALSKGMGTKEQSALEGAMARSASKSEDDQELEGLSDKEKGTGMEGEVPEDALASAEELPQAEEAPTKGKTLPETPKPLYGAGKEPPKVKQSMETLTGEQLAAAQVKGKKSDKSVAFEPKEGSVSKKDKSKGETKTSAPDAGGEKGVAATAQPAIQGAAFHADKVQETSEASRSATIRELAAQIVERIQVMRKDDLTSTIITLRHPPVMAGSTITLTSSDNAKREFNISFANLSPDAKVFLDRKLKEDSLTETLERKGIIVHNITTTTEPEKVISADAGQASKDRQDQQQEQQQQQKRQSFPGTEEEEVT